MRVFWMELVVFLNQGVLSSLDASLNLSYHISPHSWDKVLGALPRPAKAKPYPTKEPDLIPRRALPRPDLIPRRALPRPDLIPRRALPRPDLIPRRALPRPDLIPRRALPRPDLIPRRALQGQTRVSALGFWL